MAEVKYNTTLENKVNTITLTRKDEVGEPDPFIAGTTLYISRLDGATDSNLSANGYPCSIDANILAVQVDLSGVTLGVNTDYDHPVYEHMYSVRTPIDATPGRVYLYGKLNIVAIA